MSAEALEIVGEKIRGGLSREGLSGVLIQRCLFWGGPTCLRLTNCTGIIVEHCTFGGMTGPADPNGQAIQFDKSIGIIRGNVFNAARKAEDLVSIYADKSVSGEAVDDTGSLVLIDGNTFNGRGDSMSGNSLCLDGPTPPQTRVLNNKFNGARSAITIAGGVGHIIEASNQFNRCGVKVYVYQPDEYKSFGAPFGPFDIRLPAGDVLT